MARLLFAVGLFGLLSVQPAMADDIVYVSLTPHANQKLDEPFHSGSEGNNLPIPKGVQTFADVKFKIEAGALQLGSTMVTRMPEKIEGVKVGKAVAALHFLQGTGGTGDNNNISDGDKIGEYIVHYDDRTTATIPIVFGEDLRDWWNWDNSKKVTRGKVAWEGANERCKLSGLKLRLYVTTWDNPSPSKTITHLDFVTDKKTTCAPFCVAITGEENNVEKGPQ